MPKETPKEVYVILGKKMPHVYTSLKRAYRGLQRRFPDEARIVVGQEDLGPLTEDTFIEAMLRYSYIQVNALTHFHRVCKTYIDDILPKGERDERQTREYTTRPTQEYVARTVGDNTSDSAYYTRSGRSA